MIPGLSDQKPDQLLEIIDAWAEWHGVTFSAQAGADLARMLHGVPEAKSRKDMADLMSRLNAAEVRAASAEQKLSLMGWLNTPPPWRTQ